VVQSGLVELILQERNPGGFFKHSDNMLANLGKTYKEVFTPRMVKSITKNLTLTFYMHHWREYDGRAAELERLVTQEIQKLNFPYHLS